MGDTEMRAKFEATMGDALKADQGEWALSRAYDAEQSYTFLATKWAWKAWQLAAAPVAAQEPGRIINRLVTALHTRSMIAYPGKSHAEIQAEILRIVGPYDFKAAYDEDAPVAAQPMTPPVQEVGCPALDAAALEAATMALLHKEKNPAPDVDWLASRNGTVTQWKERVYYAITAYLTAAPVAAQQWTDQQLAAIYYAAQDATPSRTPNNREYNIALTRKILETAAPVAAQEPLTDRQIEVIAHESGMSQEWNRVAWIPFARACIAAAAPVAAGSLIAELREHDDPRLYHEADVLMSRAADRIAELEAQLAIANAWAMRDDATQLAAPVAAQEPVAAFHADLAAKQEPLPADMQTVLHANAWELYADGSQPAPGARQPVVFENEHRGFWKKDA